MTGAIKDIECGLEMRFVEWLSFGQMEMDREEDMVKQENSMSAEKNKCHSGWSVWCL